MEQIGAFDLPYKREEELPDKPDSFLSNIIKFFILI